MIYKTFFEKPTPLSVTVTPALANGRMSRLLHDSGAIRMAPLSVIAEYHYNDGLFFGTLQALIPNRIS